MSENCCTPPEPESTCACDKQPEPENEPAKETEPCCSDSNEQEQSQSRCSDSSKAETSRCGSKPDFITGSVETDLGQINQVSTALTGSDKINEIKCRMSDKFRSDYKVDPGLYAVGNPDKESPVLVSANYKLSFDHLRRELAGLNGWILVLDTKGINVWCAAGKGTFGTQELMNQIRRAQLDSIVDHRKLIVPQLGAPKMQAHVIKKETGFAIKYGPVYAKNIKDYLTNKMKATRAMRTVRFTMLDRFVLTPMELNGAIKKYWIFFLVVFGIFGLQPRGILFENALKDGLLFYGMGIVSILTGAFFTPLLLPFIPFRSFAVKGFIVGVLPVLWLQFGSSIEIAQNVPVLVAMYLFFPVVSSYLAFNFTGCTTFTSPAGVLKEMKIAIPVYIIACILSLISIVWYKLQVWGIIV